MTASSPTAPAVAGGPRTHLAIDPRFSGRLAELAPGRSRVVLETTPEMRADERGLVHGGFVFSLADYAAMLAVDDPHVVLGQAEVHFHRPVVVEEALEAEARVTLEEGKKRRVHVVVSRHGERVFEGDFLAIVPDRHVLDGHRLDRSGGSR